MKTLSYIAWRLMKGHHNVNKHLPDSYKGNLYQEHSYPCERMTLHFTTCCINVNQYMFESFIHYG